MKFSKTREMHKPLLKVQILIPTRISFRELHSFLLLLFFFFTTVNAKETAKTNATFSLTIYSSKQSKAKKWQNTKPNPSLISPHRPCFGHSHVAVMSVGPISRGLWLWIHSHGSLPHFPPSLLSLSSSLSINIK